MVHSKSLDLASKFLFDSIKSRLVCEASLAYSLTITSASEMIFPASSCVIVGSSHILYNVSFSISCSCRRDELGCCELYEILRYIEQCRGSAKDQTFPFRDSVSFPNY